MASAKIVNLEEFRHARQARRRGGEMEIVPMSRQRELWKYIEGNFKFPDDFCSEDEGRETE